MGNITDTARSETRDFAAHPFDDVDALVLSQLMYERMPSCVPTLADAERQYGSFVARLRSCSPRHPLRSLKTLWRRPFPSVPIRTIDHNLGPSDFRLDTNYAGLGDPECTAEFFRVLAVNPRYAPLGFGAYEELHDEARQMQFAAMTVDLGRIPRVTATEPPSTTKQQPAATNRTADQDSAKQTTTNQPTTAKQPDTGPSNTPPAPTLAVVFRGTDTSLVGWKEDLNMACQYPIPAQEAAARYLARVADLWPGRLLVMGHSKGGNLAVYAAMAVPETVRERIDVVYSLDGPGFLPGMMGSHAPEYHAVKAKVRKIVPESSSVGMIFEQLDDDSLAEYAAFVPVRSDGTGVMQHFAFTWQIGRQIGRPSDSKTAATETTTPEISETTETVDGGFSPAPDGLSPIARRFNKSLNDWVLSMPVEQRRRVIDSVYDVLRASGVTSIVDLPKSLPGSIPAMLGAVRSLSADDLAQAGSALRLLAAATLNNLGR
ncbi:Mbeg1-like protein [Bifidobacterium simiarum]|nr:Mbeg1-like protein [Bifidobacterium simiarum]